MLRKWPAWTWICGGLAALLHVVPAASAPGNTEHSAALERLVRQDCGSCHGMTLKGGLGPQLNAARFANVEPGAIARIILDGVPGTPMPSWRPLLSEEDALWIARYLKEAGQ